MSQLRNLFATTCLSTYRHVLMRSFVARGMRPREKASRDGLLVVRTVGTGGFELLFPVLRHLEGIFTGLRINYGIWCYTSCLAGRGICLK